MGSTNLEIIDMSYQFEQMNIYIHRVTLITHSILRTIINSFMSSARLEVQVNRTCRIACNPAIQCKTHTTFNRCTQNVEDRDTNTAYPTGSGPTGVQPQMSS